MTYDHGVQEGTIELDDDEGDMGLEGWDLPPDLLNPHLSNNVGGGGDVPGARFIHQVQLHMPPSKPLMPSSAQT